MRPSNKQRLGHGPAVILSSFLSASLARRTGPGFRDLQSDGLLLLPLGCRDGRREPGDQGGSVGCGVSRARRGPDLGAAGGLESQYVG